MEISSHTAVIEQVAPNLVITDQRVNTRPVDRAWVARKLKLGYDQKRVGVPTVSAREDGSFVWLDGQNRGSLCDAAGQGHVEISMKVFRGLTLAEEAELFLGLNDNRRVTPIYKFLAEVTAGRQEAMEISSIAGRLGWSISDTNSANNIHAVAALRSIYRSTKQPGMTLRNVLSIVTQAWSHVPEAVNANMMLGLASVLNDCPSVNTATMVRKLGGHDGGPSSILGKGRSYRSATGCTVTQGVDQVIRSVYNAGRRAERVPTWGPPSPRKAHSAEQMRVSF